MITDDELQKKKDDADNLMSEFLVDLTVKCKNKINLEDISGFFWVCLTLHQKEKIKSQAKMVINGVPEDCKEIVQKSLYTSYVKFLL